MNRRLTDDELTKRREHPALWHLTPTDVIDCTVRAMREERDQAVLRATQKAMALSEYMRLSP